MDARILVTGASGNLGRALALRLAGPGVRLSLWGRDTDRLAQTAAFCENQGAVTSIRSLDLLDLGAVLAALDDEDGADPFDMALFAAGQGDTLRPSEIVEDPLQIARLGQANFVAPAAMAAALGTRMAARGTGRIGLIGTAAAAHSLPFAAAYSGSKAGLSRFTDALRLSLRDHGVTVTLVSPGFFNGPRSGIAQAPRPGEISVDRVAAATISAVRAGRAECVVPQRFLLLRWFDRLLPRPLRDRVLLSLRLP